MTHIDERAEFEKWLGAPNDSWKDDPLSVGYIQMEAWQARAALPTAEVSEDEVVEIMAKGMEPTYSDTYSSKELIEKALSALSDNGYKVVRK